jgi:neutral ceramidase
MTAGAAQIDNTPDFQVELCGFASRTQPSLGVREPIFARAIFLDDGPEKLLWLGCDVIALERDFVESFRNRAKRELNLEPHQVLLSATHTHSAPATIHLNAAGRYSERYVTFLGAQLRLLAKAALVGAVPCDLIAGQGTLNLSIDRRKQPTAHVDPIVSAIAFRRPGDVSHIAAVVNYTMHPVALGHVERKISPDWCGATSTTVARGLAGKPIALVSNGAAGNINPPAEGQSPDVVRGYGEQVGKAAIEALRSATSPSGSEPQGRRRAANLKVKSITVPVPLDWHDAAGIDAIASKFLATIQPGWAWEAPFRTAIERWSESTKAQVASGEGREVPIELQAIRLGDVTIVAVNGEMFTRFTDILRRRTSQNLFTVAYANSAFGYIPTREAYAEGGYEVDTAHFFYNSFRPKPGGLELLADRAVELVNSL